MIKKDKITQLNLILLIAVIVAVISFSLLSPIQNAYADYEHLTSDYIVNFNQLCSVNSWSGAGMTLNQVGVGNGHLEGTATSQAYATISSNFNFTNGHKYFIRSNISNTLYVNVDNISYYFQSEGLVFTANSTMSNPLKLVLIVGEYYNLDLNAILIDLTLMFSEGNEPNLEQCQSYFISSYYSYNTGTPMPYSASYMEGYNKGISDTLNSFTYKLNNASVQQSMQNVNIDGYYGEVTRYSNYVVVEGRAGYNATGYLPFLAPIPVGAHFKISARVTHNDGNGTLPVQIGYMDNGSMQILSQFNVTGGYANSYTAEFDTNVDLSGLYFILFEDSSNFKLTIYNATIEVLNIDYSKMVEAAVQNAISETKQDYTVGGTGYQAIYQEGYNAGLDNGNTIGDAWDFIGGTFTSIGAIFSLEVMPNITLGVFIAIPLLLGLLLFILKITRS